MAAPILPLIAGAAAAAGRAGVKAYKSMKASKTARGAEKDRLKKENERQGMSETQAANKAHADIQKARGRDTAIEKTDVKQSSKDSKFLSSKEKGGNKTLALQGRSTGEGATPGGRFVKIGKETDDMSPTRRSEYRQRLRSVGEKMTASGLKEAAKSDAKKAGAAIAGGAAAAAASSMASKKEEGKKDTAETKAGKEDTRVNPKDYPTYQKKTESASEFRKAYTKAKEGKKDSFTFEGRKYNTEDAMKDKKEMKKGGMVKMYGGGMSTKKMMGGGMAKGYAKGGMAKCGASNPASGGKK